ncbi:hypothetical protein LG299_12210 [Microbacterium lacus]|uniref:arsenate reductase/protein-tyrosine-phosphatase family protein n=1 Tax=Microbacterium lacus TaxID=415217 RepID=UPI00384EBDC7
MAERFTVLTVCTGNIHRSPLAADLLRTWAEWYLPQEVAASIVVESAGTGAPVGRSMGRTASRIAQALGAEPAEHRARQLADDMIERADLVLVAATHHRDDVLARVPRALRKVFTVREAGRIAELLLPDAGAGVAVRAGAAVTQMRARVAAFSDNRAAGGTGVDDIIDPHGLGTDAYLQMTIEAVEPLTALAGVLFGMPQVEVDAYRAFVADTASVRRLIATAP